MDAILIHGMGRTPLAERYLPFGTELNDGLLTVKETILPNIPMQILPVVHTFIMNSKIVTQDIVKIARGISQ